MESSEWLLWGTLLSSFEWEVAYSEAIRGRQALSITCSIDRDMPPLSSCPTSGWCFMGLAAAGALQAALWHSLLGAERS